MLTRLQVRNFKQIEYADIELGGNVVFVGPNNSGKTTALQALALWHLGLKRCVENSAADVYLNRKELTSLPVSDAADLWTNSNVLSGPPTDPDPLHIGICVEGVSSQEDWECEIEFQHGNGESIHSMILQDEELAVQAPELAQRQIEDVASAVELAFIPPMSGITETEALVQPGRMDVLIGEGQTAQVLRNLCYRLLEENPSAWEYVVGQINDMFGVILHEPEYLSSRGELRLYYDEGKAEKLDISSAGRGMLQVLFLLTYMSLKPGAVLLLDEPDAHLEILRQREIYTKLTEAARRTGGQIIAASHSEVVLEEASDKDVVISFVGQPHRIDDRSGVTQTLKALKSIGWRHYLQAEQTGWVLYLEGSTDLSILQAFARILDHPAQKTLERPFVEYVGNQIGNAEKHFYGVREARPDLRAVAVLDQDAKVSSKSKQSPDLAVHRRQVREIENHLCNRDVLLRFAEREVPGESATAKQNTDLFAGGEAKRRVEIMEEEIEKLASALDTLGKPTPWSDEIKATDDFLDPLFRNYYKRLGLPNLLRKTDYHRLCDFVEAGDIGDEVSAVLNLIVSVAEGAAK